MQRIYASSVCASKDIVGMPGALQQQCHSNPWQCPSGFFHCIFILKKQSKPAAESNAYIYFLKNIYYLLKNVFNTFWKR